MALQLVTEFPNELMRYYEEEDVSVSGSLQQIWHCYLQQVEGGRQPKDKTEVLINRKKEERETLASLMDTSPQLFVCPQNPQKFCIVNPDPPIHAELLSWINYANQIYFQKLYRLCTLHICCLLAMGRARKYAMALEILPLEDTQ